MSLRVEDPWWLMVALIGGALAVVAWPWLAGMGRLRRVTVVVARIVLLAALAAALSGTADRTESDDLAVVVAIDDSGSVRRFGDQDVARRAAELVESLDTNRGGDDLLGIVAFDAYAVAVASPTRAGVTDRAIEGTGGEGSNLASALELASAMIPPDASGRIVLISDGNETGGDALATARRLASRGGASGGIRVDVVPVAYRVGAETIVESVDAPPSAPGGSRVTIRVIMNSTRGSEGTVRLYRNGSPIDAFGDPPGGGRGVRLGAGRTPVLFDVELPDARLHRFEAVFTPAERGDAGGDMYTDNNRGEAFTVSPGQGSVLLVDGVSRGNPTGPGSNLARAFEEGGTQVRVVAPSGTPADLLGLQAYDMIVLQSVAADELPPGAIDAIEAHVRELGAGLIMVGGPGSFGAGAWKGTPIEDILPVRLDLPERLVVPETAIVLVLDSSGSMSGRVGGSTRSQQEIANQAAIAAVETLDARDLVGVVEFESDARWVTELAPNDRPELTASRIADITAGGGTNLPPALALAGEALRASEAKVKHIVVLTDGVSAGSESLPEAAQTLALDGINVSTIAVGDGADTETLRVIAERGGGSFYRVSDPNVLPRVFVKAVRVVRSPMIREAPFTPVVVDPSSPALLGLGVPPELGGLVLTQFRPDPRAVRALATPEGEPVLAHWTVELGRVAAFTSDAHRWAEGWLDWPGYRQMWNQLAQLVSRSSGGGRSSLRLTQSTEGIELTYTAVDDRGAPQDLLTIPVSIYAPGGDERRVVLEQVGPGVYRGTTESRATGTYVAVATPRLGTSRLAPSIAGTSVASGVEYERLSSNTALLEQMARVTGGRVLSFEGATGAGAPGVWSRDGLEPRVTVASLWRSLLFASLVILVLDVATRRIAWDRLAAEGLQTFERTERTAVATLASLRQRTARTRQAKASSGATDDTGTPVEHSVPAPPRVAPKRAPDEPRVIDKTEQGDDAGGGLLAAKRRARERFEDG